MSLWVDKHRPRQLSQLDYHKPQADQLKKLVDSPDFPHLLFYGPSGAGKRTRVQCILRELYGAGVEKMRIEQRPFTTPSNKKIEMTTLSSNFHIELNASDAGVHDRVIVQSVIKSMAENRQLETGAQREFKVVVLTDVDRLTKDAQHALRRTMEKYMATCRLILITTSLSKVIAPVRSRCLPIRVSAPDNEVIGTILSNVCGKEATTLPPALGTRIAVKSKGNLRRALLMLETCHANEEHMLPDQEIHEPDWLVYVRQTAAMVVKTQSPDVILQVRERFYELITRCIEPSVIFSELLTALLATCPPTVRPKLISLASEYEHRMQLGAKPIYHLEAFIANAMLIIKKANDDMAAMM